MAARDQKNLHLVVSEIREETPEIKSFRLDLGPNKPFTFLPGQFVIVTAEVWNPKRNRMGLANRAFSLSSSPTEAAYIEIAAKRYFNGRLTPYLHDTLHVGDVLNIKGPEGKFVFSEGESDEIILMAGGIGIAPFRSMIRYILMKRLPTKIKLFYSARTPVDFAFASEFGALTKQHTNFHCAYTMTRPSDIPWSARVGRFDPTFLREHLGQPNALYYLCGPDPMIREHTQTLQALGVREDFIRSERW